jgi:hypothetical protein
MPEHGLATEYLQVVRSRFREMKGTAERTFAQLTDEQLFWAPNTESNSIAVIIQHLHGNMRSRWTDLFGSDGEKPDRDRDAEFEVMDRDRGALLALWEEGWAVFLQALDGLTEADMLRTIYIRKEPHSVIQAIERQMYHYGYHTGQIVYIAKQMKDAEWQTLTIPRKRK